MMSAHASGDRAGIAAQSARSPLVAAARGGAAPPDGAVSSPARVGTALGQSHEQEWIVADILTTVHRLARPNEAPPRLRVDVEGGGWSHGVVVEGRAPARLTVVGHVWAPDTYVPAARHLLGASPSSTTAVDADPGVRTALVELRPDVIREQDRAVSARLREQPRSAGAHESAALVVGAFALREGVGIFADSRRELSQMTAHLAIAQALRGTGAESRDGRLARAVLSLLAGLQRDALQTLAGLDAPDASAADRAWRRALTLRITGDWRPPMTAATATRLERFEQARALATRRGSAALLDWLETFEQDGDPVWHRIALNNVTGQFTLEASASYSRVAVEREIGEAGTVWASLQDGRAVTEAALLPALNQAVVPTVAATTGGDSLLPWTRWAAAAQRHVAAALAARAFYYRQLGAPESGQQHVDDSEARFGRLVWFPLALRSMALDAGAYRRSMAGARTIVAEHPEIVTASVWNLLMERPAFDAPVENVALLPAWIHPVVPTGTAFDLYARALQPGCPRTPPPQQAIAWAQLQPYDQWTVWSAQWLPAIGTPDGTTTLAAYGPLLDYDANANRLATQHLELSFEQNLTVAQRLCTLSAECGRHAWLLLWDGRDADAAAAYEDWMQRSRDPLGPANALEWLARHYVRSGRQDDAMRVARFAGGPGSAAGLATLAETLSSLGDASAATAVYVAIAERYRDRVPLGTHRLRLALQHGTREEQLAAMTDLQAIFPHGLEPLVIAGLDAVPRDGVSFMPLGRRATRAGLRDGDIVVGVDEWRVRNWRQYGVVMDLRPDRDAVTLTVHRDGRYQQLALQVPERTLGAGLDNVARQR